MVLEAGTFTKAGRRKFNRMLILERKGLSDDKIAAELGIKVGQLSKYRRKADYQVSVIKTTEDAKDNIRTTLIDAVSNTSSVARSLQYLIERVPATVQQLVKLSLDGKSEDRVRLDACKEILDRAGLKPVEVIETRNRSYSPDEISKAQATLNELMDVTLRLSNNDSSFVLSRVQKAIPEAVTDATSEVPEQEQKEETTSAT